MESLSVHRAEPELEPSSADALHWVICNLILTTSQLISVIAAATSTIPITTIITNNHPITTPSMPLLLAPYYYRSCGSSRVLSYAGDSPCEVGGMPISEIKTPRARTLRRLDLSPFPWVPRFRPGVTEDKRMYPLSSGGHQGSRTPPGDLWD